MKLNRRYIFTLLVFGLWTALMNGQTIKKIEVAQGEPFVDHVALKEGSADMDLMVKFAFDETENGMTVSLISYKKLFAFQDNIRYRKTKVCRKLKPRKLPYVVESDPEMAYKYMKPLRRAVDLDYVFHRWIEVEGMQPQPVDYRMVNDYIEQRFDVMPNKTKVKVALHDLIVMEKNPSRDRYDLFYHVNMDTEYEITIKRDPCFGMEESVKLAQEKLEMIKTSYDSFKGQFPPGGKVFSLEEAEVFKEMKTLLMEQYVHNDDKSKCMDIQACVDEYNVYVDSISQLTCIYEKILKTLDLSAAEILQKSRKMDNNVSRWMVSDDEAERKDLVAACEEIISYVKEHLVGAEYFEEDQNIAIAIFRKAEQYFKKMCKKK